MATEQVHEQKTGAAERILAIAAIAVLLASALALIVSLCIGFADRFALAAGPLPIVFGVAMFGFPVGFILLGVLVVRNHRARKKLTRHSANAQKAETA